MVLQKCRGLFSSSFETDAATGYVHCSGGVSLLWTCWQPLLPDTGKPGSSKNDTGPGGSSSNTGSSAVGTTSCLKRTIMREREPRSHQGAKELLKILSFLLCDTEHIRQLIHSFPTDFCLLYIYSKISQARNFQTRKDREGNYSHSESGLTATSPIMTPSFKYCARKLKRWVIS